MFGGEKEGELEGALVGEKPLDSSTGELQVCSKEVNRQGLEEREGAINPWTVHRGGERERVSTVQLAVCFCFLLGICEELERKKERQN